MHLYCSVIISCTANRINDSSVKFLLRCTGEHSVNSPLILSLPDDTGKVLRKSNKSHHLHQAFLPRSSAITVAGMSERKLGLLHCL